MCKDAGHTANNCKTKERADEEAELARADEELPHTKAVRRAQTEVAVAAVALEKAKCAPCHARHGCQDTPFPLRCEPI